MVSRFTWHALHVTFTLQFQLSNPDLPHSEWDFLSMSMTVLVKYFHTYEPCSKKSEHPSIADTRTTGMISCLWTSISRKINITWLLSLSRTILGSKFLIIKHDYKLLVLKNQWFKNNNHHTISYTCRHTNPERELQKEVCFHRNAGYAGMYSEGRKLA